MATNTKKTKQEEIVDSFRLYVLPIIVSIGFLSIIIIIIIPKIGELLEKFDQVNITASNYEAKKIELETLKKMSNNFNQMAIKLSTVNQISPPGNTEVVKFRDKIAKLITDSNLTLTSQRVGETEVDINKVGNQNINNENSNTTGSKAGSSALILQEVPFLFEAKGKLENIKTMLDMLSLIDDFVIIKQMDISRSGIDWAIQLNLVKYQFKITDQQALNNIYINVPLNIEINKKFAEYLETKIDEINL